MIADARPVPPSPLRGAISRYQFGRSVDCQLVASKPRYRRRCLCWIFKKGAEKPQRAKLHRDAEAVVIAAVRANECPIRIVEVKMTRELFRSWISDKATISKSLIVREKADWHRFGLCRSRGPGPALGQQFASPFSRLSFRIDIGIKR